MERCNFWRKNKKQKPALLTRTCPPGLVVAGREFLLLREQLLEHQKMIRAYIYMSPSGPGACENTYEK